MSRALQPGTLRGVKLSGFRLASTLREVLALAPDLAAILGLSLVQLALMAAQPAGPLAILRIVLGLPFVLFFPGYTLQAALFAPRDDLDGPQRLALAFGLSVASIPPVALLLDKLPWGLRLWPIVISLFLVILAGSAAALVRRWRLPADQRPVYAVAVDVPGWWGEQDRTNRILYSLFVGAVLTAFISAGVIMFSPKPGERFTEFYMLGPEGLAESFPREAVVGQPIGVTVGITNREGVPARYTLQASVEGETASVGPVVTLEPGSTWEQIVSFAMPNAGDDQLIEITLKRDGQPAPYRRLRLWINVKPAGGP